MLPREQRDGQHAVTAAQGVNLVVVASDRKAFQLADEVIVPGAANNLDVARLALALTGLGPDFLVACGRGRIAR